MFYFYPYPIWMAGPYDTLFSKAKETPSTEHIPELPDEIRLPFFGEEEMRGEKKGGPFFDPLEGFMKGNLICKEYRPYRHYKEGKLEARNERESLLLSIMVYYGAIHDLALLLDVNPKSQENLKLLEKYRKKLLEETKEYEDKYGALSEVSTSDKKGYDSYVLAPSPWRIM